MDFLDLCKKIIGIDSTPAMGNEEVAKFCADLCEQSGFKVKMQEGTLDGKRQFNLLARPSVKSASTEEVIFQTHLDTVEPGPMGYWTKTDNNPFAATVEGDLIYGLGSADVKLDFLCKFRALKDFTKLSQKKPFVLVGTFGEEIGMHGAHLLMESKAVKSKMAIIGEPSELKIVHANNGYIVTEFLIPFSQEELSYLENQKTSPSATTQEKVFHGKAVHSSTPQLGENAILKLIEYLAKLPEGIAILEARGGSVVNTVPADAHVEVDGVVTFSSSIGSKLVKLVREFQKLEREFLNFEDPSVFPPYPTLNVGVLKTNEEGLKVKVSLRMPPNITDKQIQDWLSHLGRVATILGVRCIVERISYSALTSLESPLVLGAQEISKQMKLQDKPIAKAGGTESSVYRKYGIDCIVFGPGVSLGNSHTANEHNSLKQLEKAVDFYGHAFKRFCL